LRAQIAEQKVDVLNSVPTNVVKLFQGKAPTEDKALTQVTFAEIRSTLEWWSAW